MIPHTVTFTGADINPRDLVSPRKISRPAPPSWVRIQFPTPVNSFVDVYQIDNWIASRIAGRWAVQPHFLGGVYHIVIHFENPTDAVMFRLMDGETLSLGSVTQF